MAQEGHTPTAARIAVIWLTGAALLLSPVGIGEAVASVTGGACEAPCPCDVSALAEASDEGGASTDHGCDGDGSGSGHHDGAAQHEAHHQDCEDGCPDCSCCPEVVLGVLPQVLPGISTPSHAFDVLTRPDMPASGTSDGVFRPPRARA